MLSSVFRYPMPLLLWNWSACRKNLLLYETLQHLWKQLNLVYAQCSISPGIIQNSPQTRLSSSLGVGLSLAIWDCSIKLLPGFCIQLPPLSRTYSLLMLLKRISTSYRCFCSTNQSSSSTSRVLYENDCSYPFCVLLSHCFLYLCDFDSFLTMVSPSQPQPLHKAIHCYTVGLH